MDCLLKARDRSAVGAETLIDYCAGTLDASRVAELEAHVASCAECRGLVEAQRSVWNSLDQAQAADLDAARFDRELLARIAQEDAAPWWRRAWRTWSQPKGAR